MAKPLTILHLKLAAFFLASLLLLSASLFAAYLAVEARYSVLEVYFSQTAILGKDRALILISNMSFYAALLAWYAVICWPVFKSNLLKRILITIALVAYLLFSWFLSKTYFVGSGQALFSVYYLFSQFNIYQHSYFSFALLVMLFSAGVVLLSATTTLLASIKQKNWIRLAALAATLCLFALSFLQLSTAPKYINLANWPYLLSSASFTPSKEAFEKRLTQASPALDISKLKEEKPNIVIIVLETTRRDAISFYNSETKAKTPFLDSLANKSAVFTQAQAVMPNTLKVLVSINCGIDPYLNYPILESTLGVPTECLAERLREIGYETRFVQSATAEYGNILSLVEQLGYEKSFAAESFKMEDFQWVDFTGIDDRAILDDNKRWLEQVNRPFIVSYLTVGPHYPYTLYDRENKQQYIDADSHVPARHRSTYNNYLNAVVHQDDFISKLFQQFEQAGKLDDTVFIIVGDHGASFGEHPVSQRLNNVYQEVLAVPLIIYAPSYIQKGEVYDDLLAQADIPTLISNSVNSGRSLVSNIERKAVFSSCWYWSWCIARKDSRYKYIYNFANGPDELYDLSVDAIEKHNIADLQPEIVKQFRQEALDWYYQQLANYGGYYSKVDPDFYIKGHPVTTKVIFPSFSSAKQE